MSDGHSDALVFFGATGDLTYKKIFPALQAMVKRGHLEAWRIVDPVLNDVSPIHEYEPGSWGPTEVDAKVSPPGGWQNPTLGLQ